MQAGPFSVEELRQWLDYDPATGVLTWKQGVCPCCGNAGARIVGYGQKQRHIRVKFKGKTYLAHRFAWALHYGVWPTRFIDHKNGDPTDNRIENLREATREENGRNSALSVRNTTGVKGVTFNKKTGTYRAFIKISGKLIWLGSFATISDAAQARKLAAESNYGEFSRH